MHQDLPPELVEDIDEFCDPLPKVLDDIEGLLTDNRIFKQRNVDIGIINRDDAMAWGFSGRDAARHGRRLGFAQRAAL